MATRGLLLMYFSVDSAGSDVPNKFGPGDHEHFNIDLAEYIDDLLLSTGSLLSRTVRRIVVKDIFNGWRGRRH